MCWLRLQLQSSNEVLPFSDLSLMIDPVSPSQNLESFFSPSSHDLFDLSAGLLDASSDTSSILTLSPPSTPAISLSPGPSASVASLPEIKDCFDHSGCLDLLSDFRSSEVSFVSDDIFREVNEKDPLILDTESFPFFDPSLSMFSLNTNFPNISSLPVPWNFRLLLWQRVRAWDYCIPHFSFFVFRRIEPITPRIRLIVYHSHYTHWYLSRYMAWLNFLPPIVPDCRCCYCYMLACAL